MWNFQLWSFFCLGLEFPRVKVTILEIIGFFQKSLSSTTHVWFFCVITLLKLAGYIFLASYLIYSISEMAELAPLPHSHGQIHSHSDWLHYFLVTVSRSKYCYKNIYVNSFLLRTAMRLSVYALEFFAYRMLAFFDLWPKWL